MIAFWRALAVDVAVFAVVVLTLLTHPRQWAGFVCDLIGVP